MSDKVKHWHQRKPRQEKKSKRPLRIGNERLVPLRAGDEPLYEEDFSEYQHDNEEEHSQ